MHRMPQPTWGRAGTHTPEERVYWLNTIIFMTSQCVLKNRSFGNQNQNASLQNYYPNFWILSISATSGKIYLSWQIVSFWGYSLALFSEGFSKLYTHFFWTLCVWFPVFFSPEKGRRSLRSSCRQRGRWRAHEQVHWTRYTFDHFGSNRFFFCVMREVLPEELNPWIKFGGKFSLISNSERVVILRLGVSTCRTFCGHFYS